jgi:hypothetical protein
MDGHATLSQLQNAPAGTVFRERRYVAGAATVDGANRVSKAGAEYRTAHVVRPPWWFEQRIRQPEKGGTEPPSFEG